MNPWLSIPLADYEGHMALPHVAQSGLLADLLAAAVQRHRPHSVAVLGCAGGNGFERVPPPLRLVGIDLNPAYVAAARQRFAHRNPPPELYVADLQTQPIDCAPVDLVFAGLLFEYVTIAQVLQRIPALLTASGVLVTVVQRPSATVAEVTPSPFTSLTRLVPALHLVAPEALRASADTIGLIEIAAETTTAAGGKQFRVQTFGRDHAP